MRSRFIAVGMVMVFVVAIFAGCDGKAISYSWSTSGLKHSEKDDCWELEIAKANGFCTRKVDLSSEELTALSVENTSSGGVVSVMFLQGNKQKVIDASGAYNSNIDMSDFKQGRVEIRLEFKKAENVDLAIRW